MHTGTQDAVVVNSAVVNSWLLSSKYKGKIINSILQRGRQTAAWNNVCIKSVHVLDDLLKQDS